jgi:hypothetical protein
MQRRTNSTVQKSMRFPLCFELLMAPTNELLEIRRSHKGVKYSAVDTG